MSWRKTPRIFLVQLFWLLSSILNSCGIEISLQLSYVLVFNLQSNSLSCCHHSYIFISPLFAPFSKSQGLISESKGKELDDALGPAPMTSGPVGNVDYLRAEALELNSNTALKEAILADLEPVSSAHIICFLEFFAYC